jgi:hypothetical protein
MRKTVSAFFAVAIISLVLTACSGPSVKEVPITAPWDKMNLPIKDARVWHSDNKEIRILHNARRPDVAQTYLNALEKEGWRLVERQPVEELIMWTFDKDGRRMKVKIADFPEGGTNVIIDGLE